ncbi:MAG: hypothetical protein MJ074_07195 [Oscillospiraceae bacterium]|nr:hypothetical protein [Oscillospiraceae bacterium]
MKILQNIADLIKVKTIVTLMVTAVFVVLSLRGDINSTDSMAVVIMVVGFYFGTQQERRTAQNQKKEDNT